MQSLLQRRIERLGRLRTCLFLTLIVYWAGLVAYFPLAPGETLFSSSWKCGLVIALVLPGLATKLKPWIKSVCFNAAILIGLFTNPLNWEAASVYSNWLSIPSVTIFVVLLITEVRRIQLTRYADIRLN